MKKILSTVLALAMVVSLGACGSSGGGSSSGSGSGSGDTIKIGYFSDMSSADGYIGMAGRYAIEDRIEELNAQGGLLGKQLELVAYDTRNALKCFPTAAVRLTLYCNMAQKSFR